MKLRDYKAEFYELQDLIENHEEVNEETGEVIDNTALIQELREELQKDQGSLIDFFCDLRREADADAEQLQKEIARLQQRKKGCVSRKDSALNQLDFICAGIGVKTLDNTIYYSKLISLSIEDEAAVPAEFISFDPKIDKANLKKAVVAGRVEVEGIEIVEKISVRMR